jgi:hypothetical protein
MAKFDMEERQEVQKIEGLRKLLHQVEQPQFLDNLGKAYEAGAGEEDSFLTAIRRRAENLNMRPQDLLRNYVKQLRESTYPSPECLDADAVQRIATSKAFKSEEAVHVEHCIYCNRLLASCAQTQREREGLRARIHNAAASAEAQTVEKPSIAESA